MEEIYSGLPIIQNFKILEAFVQQGQIRWSIIVKCAGEEPAGAAVVALRHGVVLKQQLFITKRAALEEALMYKRTWGK